MKAHEIYIITDIDGTVVPHPYHAGLSKEDRKPYVSKLRKLIHNHHVACITGRTFRGWERLWRDADYEPAAPRLLGLCFGAETFYHGRLIPAQNRSPDLEAVIHELRSALERNPDFRIEAEVAEIMKIGKLQGYFIEEKPRIIQIDWNFPSEHLNHQFSETVFSCLNRYLARKHALKCQVFHNRIDILAEGFVPKAELTSHIEHWVLETRLARTQDEDSLNAKPDCIVLGDELYDDYLFESVKTLASKVFANVRCIGVQHPHTKVEFRFADEIVRNESDVWTLIEELAPGPIEK